MLPGYTVTAGVSVQGEVEASTNALGLGRACLERHLSAGAARSRPDPATLRHRLRGIRPGPRGWFIRLRDHPLRRHPPRARGDLRRLRHAHSGVAGFRWGAGVHAERHRHRRSVARARSGDGVTWEELAESQTDLFRSDMEALSVLPPTHYIGVVESMELISRGVTEMLEADAAYWVGPDLYADLAADSRFGSIGHYDHDTQMRFFAERGGDPQTPGKRNALDPLLWRGEREGEPAWDGGKLGPGRPGWHVECSIIAREYLSIPFVVQGGGEDLIFPHHEM